ncbi:MAG: MATE family efflux transporter [Dongiaceae bacterium]
MLSNLSVPLLGIVDTAVVGRLPNSANIGAVAVGAIIFDFLYWGFGFLRMGTSGFVAQSFGAGDRQALRDWFGRGLILAVLIAAFLLLLQWPAREVAFWLMTASQDVEALGRTYFDIRIWSAPATLANYVILGWLLATQRPMATLFLQVFMNGLNILLDVIFVFGFGWGVAGVAIATVIAEYGTAAIGLVTILILLRGTAGEWLKAGLLDRAKMLAMLRVNRDIFIRTICLIFAFAYFTASGGRLGNTTLAANAILLHMQTLMAYGLDGFAFAAEVFVGSAIGSRSRQALREAVRTASMWAGGLALIIAGIYGLFGVGIVNLFTTIEVVRLEAYRYLPWVALAPLLSIASFMFDGIYIGATRTAEMRNGMILALGIYLAGVWLLVPHLDNHGLWLAFLIWMVARAVPLALWYPRIPNSILPADSA